MRRHTPNSIAVASARFWNLRPADAGFVLAICWIFNLCDGHEHIVSVWYSPKAHLTLLFSSEFETRVRHLQGYDNFICFLRYNFEVTVWVGRFPKTLHSAWKPNFNPPRDFLRFSSETRPLRRQTPFCVCCEIYLNTWYINIWKASLARSHQSCEFPCALHNS